MQPVNGASGLLVLSSHAGEERFQVRAAQKELKFGLRLIQFLSSSSLQ